MIRKSTLKLPTLLLALFGHSAAANDMTTLTIEDLHQMAVQEEAMTRLANIHRKAAEAGNPGGGAPGIGQAIGLVDRHASPLVGALSGTTLHQGAEHAHKSGKTPNGGPDIRVESLYGSEDRGYRARLRFGNQLFDVSPGQYIGEWRLMSIEAQERCVRLARFVTQPGNKKSTTPRNAALWRHECFFLAPAPREAGASEIAR